MFSVSTNIDKYVLLKNFEQEYLKLNAKLNFANNRDQAWKADVKQKTKFWWMRRAMLHVYEFIKIFPLHKGNMQFQALKKT